MLFLKISWLTKLCTGCLRAPTWFSIYHRPPVRLYLTLGEEELLVLDISTRGFIWIQGYSQEESSLTE